MLSLSLPYIPTIPVLGFPNPIRTGQKVGRKWVESSFYPVGRKWVKSGQKLLSTWVKRGWVETPPIRGGFISTHPPCYPTGFLPTLAIWVFTHLSFYPPLDHFDVLALHLSVVRKFSLLRTH